MNAISGSNGNLFEMVFSAGPMVKFVLIVLLLFSVASWAIIIYKYRLFNNIEKETLNFLNLYRKEAQNVPLLYEASRRFVYTPYTKLYKAAYEEYRRLWRHKKLPNSSFSTNAKENIQRVMKKTLLAEINEMEKFLPFLATTGNTAPFIGLFGTVWGIMNSFQDIGMKGSANLAVVAPGISEALIATAMGLVAAIPAVVAYNFFTSRLNKTVSEAETFSDEIISIFSSSAEKKETA
jgi:biopolymer transport protein TolQ